MQLIKLLIISVYVLRVHSSNLTAWENLRRTKRYLIFQNSAVVKFVGGITFPIRLEDRVPYRQMVVLNNIQAQYDLPTLASNWIPKWTGRTLEKVKETFMKFGTYPKDPLRNLVYTVLEAYLNKVGRNGRECLQRAFCENGEYAENDGVIAEIVHAVLTPAEHNSDKEFLDAYSAGKSGANCLSMFPKCQHGDSFLDRVIFLKKL